ncbi:hypothetical protein COO60DRAFT_1517284 [Scenedesmus sp. NREL 46B-D3]|nr:hypothetical protein COO60DRAFT_1517284 [Scenedesmus sp. NREL 46B-D3]
MQTTHRRGTPCHSACSFQTIRNTIMFQQHHLRIYHQLASVNIQRALIQGNQLVDTTVCPPGQLLKLQRLYNTTVYPLQLRSCAPTAAAQLHNQARQVYLDACLSSCCRTTQNGNCRNKLRRCISCLARRPVHRLHFGLPSSSPACRCHCCTTHQHGCTLRLPKRCKLQSAAAQLSESTAQHSCPRHEGGRWLDGFTPESPRLLRRLARPLLPPRQLEPPAPLPPPPCPCWPNNRPALHKQHTTAQHRPGLRLR